MEQSAYLAVGHESFTSIFSTDRGCARIDTTCALLPPCRRPTTNTPPSRGVMDKIVGALCTRFGGTVHATRAALKDAVVDEWGRVRILPDGDTVKAACYSGESTSPVGLVPATSRDSTWVRVCARNFSRTLILNLSLGASMKPLSIEMPMPGIGRSSSSQKPSMASCNMYTFFSALPSQDPPLQPLSRPSSLRSSGRATSQMSTKPSISIFTPGTARLMLSTSQRSSA